MSGKLVAAAVVALPLAVGGIVYASTQAKSAEQAQQIEAAIYTCPLTGEELPCPNCCPLNDEK